MKNYGSIVLFLLTCQTTMAFDLIKIGHPENPANKFGYGKVNYYYYISKYEITNQEYCEFLNCVASPEDTFMLFSPLMEQHFLGGIIRKGTSKGYSYLCKQGYESCPAVCITWMNAIRYINWLHYNAVNIEKDIPVGQWLKETEGDDLSGAYDTRKIPDSRNKGAIYWLPNRSEWEKAAYYDGQEWTYDTVPSDANCFSPASGWHCKYPHIAQIGKSKGPNDTYDQQGNAAEWVEDSRGTWKLALGGSVIRPKQFSYCGALEADAPDKPISTFGFRICKTTDSIHTPSLINRYAPTAKDTVDNQSLLHQYVLISDINNPGDPLNQYKGAVGYDYYISRTELSNAEYCKFLNSVADDSDPYHLYNNNMETGICGGIIRLTDGQKYRYECKPGWENKPVVYVSYYDIARYANWMHYGCPSGGASIIRTTEGTDKLGAYDTRYFEAVRNGDKAPYRKFGIRNKGAKYWIPNEDEWFKAAYYDPTLNGNRKYYNYPTRTDDPPSRHAANYMVDNELSVGPPYFVTDVDNYADYASYYGTVQQGGNVWEWIESWQYGIIGNRGLKGGSWSYTAYGLNACNTDPGGINDISYVFGARLCKSYGEQGWYPASKPIIQSVYEYIMLLPKSRIVVGIILFACCIIFISILLLHKIFSRLCGKN